MSVLFWLTMVSGGMLVCWIFLSFFAKKFGENREFVYNYHNGAFVITRRKDYLKAKGRMKVDEEGWVAVRNCVVFYGQHSVVWNKEFMVGDSTLLDSWVPVNERERECRLFVPYVSSVFMSKEDQREYFRHFTLEEAKEYLRMDSKKSFPARVWRKFADWYFQDVDRNGLSIILGIISCFFFLLFMFNGGMRVESRWQVTLNSSLKDPTAVTTFSKERMEVVNDEIVQLVLEKGVLIKDPVYMGGGLVSVLGKFDGNIGAVRASASLNLKKGDAVIVRRGEVMNGKEFRAMESWVITQAEADALIASGKFKYCKKGE